MNDIDEQIVSAGEIKALASGDPRIVQKVRLEHEIDKQLGVKTRGDRWTAQARVWRTRIRDLIVPSPTGALVGSTFGVVYTQTKPCCSTPSGHNS